MTAARFLKCTKKSDGSVHYSDSDYILNVVILSLSSDLRCSEGDVVRKLNLGEVMENDFGYYEFVPLADDYEKMEN